jgi:hypothetical protein
MEFGHSSNGKSAAAFQKRYLQHYILENILPPGGGGGLNISHCHLGEKIMKRERKKLKKETGRKGKGKERKGKDRKGKERKENE